MKSFGKREHRLEYKKRVGAYGIIQNAQQKFLTVAATDGYLFLVGGGLEEKEEPIAALQREILEETGFSARVGEFWDKLKSLGYHHNILSGHSIISVIFTPVSY